jgi:hypothetical protein
MSDKIYKVDKIARTEDHQARLEEILNERIQEGYFFVDMRPIHDNLIIVTMAQPQFEVEQHPSDILIPRPEI